MINNFNYITYHIVFFLYKSHKVHQKIGFVKKNAAYNIHNHSIQSTFLILYQDIQQGLKNRFLLSMLFFICEYSNNILTSLGKAAVAAVSSKQKLKHFLKTLISGVVEHFGFSESNISVC